MKIFEAAKRLTAELRSTISEITDALDRRANAERAAVANLNAIMAAERRIAELEASSRELDAQVVKAEAMVATDSSLKSDATKAVKAADKAAAELADERRANERRVAAGAILDAEAAVVDDVIPELKTRLQAAMAGYCKQMLAAANEDLIEACAPLIPIIQSIAAVNAVLPNGALARDWLDCAKLISPVGYRSDHLLGHVRVRGTDLLATTDPLPALPVGAATSIQEVVAISKALAQHRKYQPPKAPRTEAQERRLTASEQRWNQQQRQAIEDWKPPKGAGPLRSWSQSGPLVDPGPSASRTAGSANSPASDLNGNISDEWNRIGVGDNSQAGSGVRHEH